MKKLIALLIPLLFSTCQPLAQIVEKKDWCTSKCDAAGDEKKNSKMVHDCMHNDSIMQHVQTMDLMRFPLRFGIVQQQSNGIDSSKAKIHLAIKQLNQAYAPANLEFYVERVEAIPSSLSIEDLSADAYEPYIQFSKAHDLPDLISVYVFDHAHEFCQITPTSISCGRTGGFSFILSDITSNLVLSHFDLTDQKVVAHEFGHFFGLYHTFEEAQFGKDDFDESRCEEIGDGICDTPPDPGVVFEVYVNYSNCEMIGLENKAGKAYAPLINNYMSYYKPCYLKPYHFTPGQIQVMKIAAQSSLRKKFSR
ncbi:MAG: M43 family zinc metalloprotease [Bacteroidota bacterium]